MNTTTLKPSASITTTSLFQRAAAALARLHQALIEARQRRASRELMMRAERLQDSQPSFAADLRAAAARHLR